MNKIETPHIGELWSYSSSLSFREKRENQFIVLIIKKDEMIDHLFDCIMIDNVSSFSYFKENVIYKFVIIPDRLGVDSEFLWEKI
jgi:hypothetical protein